MWDTAHWAVKAHKRDGSAGEKTDGQGNDQDQYYSLDQSNGAFAKFTLHEGRPASVKSWPFGACAIHANSAPAQILDARDWRLFVLFFGHLIMRGRKNQTVAKPRVAALRNQNDRRTQLK
jgi:hypothetical protein